MMLNNLSTVLNQLNGLLRMGSGPVVGIDIGLSSIKVAEMTELRNGYRLNKFAHVPLPEAALIEDEIQKEEEIVEAIKQALADAGITTTSAVIAVSGPNTVVRKLQLSGGSREEIEDQVLWEAEQYLPFDIDSSSVSSYLFGENPGGGVDVLMVGAKTDVIHRFRDLVERAGLKVKIVDVNAVAIMNMFHLILPNNESTRIVMDIGAQKTTFIVQKAGVLNFCKEINVGGSMITEEIQRQLGVNFYQAEDLKTKPDAGGNLPEEVLEVVDDVLEIYFKEIKKTVDFYATAMSDEEFSDCWITGGGMLTPHLVDGLESLLNLEIKILDPMKKIQIPRGHFDAETIEKVKNYGATVLGLAMRKA